MVGVPGKYKGCETCRRRRVKCDNTRPLCRKCLDNGRDCEGYRREMVFITAGLEHGGRCSSHPPRRVSGPGRSAARAPEPPRLVLETPGSLAWDDVITLESGGARHRVRVVAFHGELGGLERVEGGRVSAGDAVSSMPDFRMPFGEELDIGSKCLVSIPGQGHGQGAGGGLCAFVYEHSTSPFPGTSPWEPEPENMSCVQSRGPQAFQSFPAHYFFARIYRPHAIGQALLNRHSTFLSSPDWTTTPWQTHPKSPVDTLLDTLSHLPALLSRADNLISAPATLQRQYALQDLHSSAQLIERRLEGWHAALVRDGGPGVCLDDRDPGLRIPFGGALSFRDGPSALACVYYWTGLLLLRPCVLAVRHAMSPVGYGGELGDGGGRRLAGWICQSLDFALAQMAQPDLLAVPLRVVEEFYGGIEGPSGEGTLELFWCDGFRERLGARGEYLAGLLRGREWTEMAQF